MISTSPIGNVNTVASLLAATLYQGNPDRNQKLWNIVSTERYILHNMQVLLDYGAIKLLIFCILIYFDISNLKK